MSDIKDQKKLTDGKGWGAVEWARESPYKVIKDVGKKVKKVMTDKFKEDIQTVKTKAKNVWGGAKVVADKLKGKD